MFKHRIAPTASIIIGASLIFAVPTMAQSGDITPPLAQATSTAGFLLLLPLGLLLLSLSALPNAEKVAPQAAVAALVVWGVAVLAYFFAGFAFQFGGVAVSNPHPDFAELYWNWSPLDVSFGTGWGFIGLRGWMLLGPAATPGVYDLFLRHAALLGAATVMPALALYRRGKHRLLPVFGFVSGTIIYPLVGNWVWSGGWLANLGINLNMGHGFVDAGIATPLIVAGVTTLMARWVFKPAAPIEPKPPVEPGDTFAEVPMPSATLPILSLLGLGLVLWSWAFAANGQHIPTAADLAIPRAALNGLLSAFAGLVTAAGYSRFVSSRVDVLMTVRGGIAGWAITVAGAALMLPWEAVAAGAGAGILLPLIVYFIDRRLGLADHTAAGAMLGVMGVLGLLLVGLVADGSTGNGWNGVSGGIAADFPAQLNAQLIGIAAVLMWSAGVTWGFFRAERWLAGHTEAAPADIAASETAEIPEL